MAAAAPAPWCRDRPRAADLHLQVLDPRTGAGVPGARLELSYRAHGVEEPERVAVAVDEAGSWRGRLDPGVIVAVAWDEQRCSTKVELELGAHQTRYEALSLHETFPVRGFVLDARTGGPVPGARIAFWTHAELDAVFTREDGSFDHPRFPQHGVAHQVHVAANDYGDDVRYLEVTGAGAWTLLAAVDDAPTHTGDQAPAELTIELVPATAIEGRVLGPDGRAVPDAVVEAVGHFATLPGVGAADSAVARTDARGHFRLAELRSDISHLMTVSAPGLARHEQVVPPTVDPVTSLGDLWLAPEVRIAGAVTDIAGTPAEGLRVSLRLAPTTHRLEPLSGRDLGAPLRGIRATTHTDDGGSFAFDGMPSGDYELKVREGRRIVLHEAFAARVGDEQNDLLLTLAPTSATLEGIVTDGHRPLVGARVDVRREGGTRIVTTDDEGRFRACGLDASSSYELHVRASGQRGEVLEGRLDEVWAGMSPSILLGEATVTGSPAGRLSGGP